MLRLNKRLPYPMLNYATRKFSSGSKYLHKPKNNPYKNLFSYFAITMITILPISISCYLQKPGKSIGDYIEDQNETKLVFDINEFECVGKKNIGDNTGHILKLKGKDDYYIVKSMSPRGLWNEMFASHFIREMMGEENAPKGIIIQERYGDQAVHMFASRIMGEGRKDQEPGKDLEEVLFTYNYASQIKQHPLKNIGAAIVLQMLLTNTDSKLANYVGYRKNTRGGINDNTYVYPIDSEHTFNKKDEMKVTTNPIEQLNYINRPLSKLII